MATTTASSDPAAKSQAEGRLRRVVQDLSAAIVFALLVAAGFGLPFVG